MQVNSNTSTLIAEWENRSRRVCLFRENNLLAYTVEGRNGVKHHFQPLYVMPYAVNLVYLFRNTIDLLLTETEPNPSCFSPILMDDAGPNAKIALFGNYYLQKVIPKLRGGVYYTDLQREEILFLNDSGSEECLRLHEEVQTPPQQSEFATRFRLIPEWENGQVKNITTQFQRSWYEKNGRTCLLALREYLSQCDSRHLPLLNQLGLSPNQIAKNCGRSEWALFQALIQQRPGDNIVKNLENNYPVLFPHIHEGLSSQLPQNEKDSILAALDNSFFGERSIGSCVVINILLQRIQNQCDAFLFIGPPGVGKKELAKLAISLKQNRHVIFDMTQFSDESAFERLFGEASSSEKPLFAREVEKYASSHTVQNIVMVFDKIELAHTKIKQTIYTLCAEKECIVQYTNLTIKYTFNKCVFIGISGLYAKELQEGYRQGFGLDGSPGEMYSRLNQSSPHPFFPDFLFGSHIKILPFSPIRKGEAYNKLIQTNLTSTLKRLKTSLNCRSISIPDLSSVLKIVEYNFYVDGMENQKVVNFINAGIERTILAQREWGNLSDKILTIVPLSENRLGIKCVRTVFGVPQEYPIVPIPNSTD